MADVVCLQEVRGVEAEALEFGVWLPGWRMEFSAIAGGRSGEVAILLSPRIQEAFPQVRWYVESGRILVAELVSRQGGDALVDIAIVCVHLVTVDGASPATQLRRLRGLLPPVAECPTVIVGDFNSVEAEEGRLHVPSGALRYENSATDATIEREFVEFAEVVVTDYSRRPFRGGDRCAEPHRWLLCRRCVQRSAGGTCVCNVFGGRHRS